MPIYPIRPALWKATDHPFHLFGSFHLGPKGGFALGKPVMDALAQAESVIMETDPRQRAIDPALFVRAGGTLSVDLGPGTYQQLQASGFYDESFESVVPGMILANIAFKGFAAMGLYREFSVDAQIEDAAASMGKTLGGLETVKESLGPLLRMSPATAATGRTGILDPTRRVSSKRGRPLKGRAHP